MKIKWFGMSSFLIISANGTRIITDPFDHSYVYSIGGNPRIYKDRKPVSEVVQIIE